MSPHPLLSHEAVLADNLPIRGQHIVDVGCGDGWLVRHLVLRGAAEVVGLETTAERVESLRETLDDPRAHFEVGRGEALPLEDDAWDALVYVNSFHHVPPSNMPLALREATRVLRTGGLLYVAEPLPEGEHFNLVRLIDDETAMRRAAAGALIERYPSTLQRLKEVFFDLPMDFASLADWEERLVRVDPHRLNAFIRARGLIEDQFAQRAERIPGGFRFRQPIWVTIFRQI
jgi:ubiquinone/menaquinone biosynthesis C-methylase UbiE